MEYFTILDYTDTLKSLKGRRGDIERFENLFVLINNPELNISPDDSGYLNSELNMDNIENPMVVSSNKFFKSVKFGKVISSQELSNIDNFYKKRSEMFGDFYSHCDIYDVFSEIRDEERVVLSSDALIDYFIETLTEFKGTIIRRRHLFAPGEKYELFLIKLEIDEEIIEKFLKDGNYIKYKKNLD